MEFLHLKKKRTQAKHDQTSSPPRATDPTWTTGVDNVWLMGPSVENVSKRWRRCQITTKWPRGWGDWTNPWYVLALCPNSQDNSMSSVIHTHQLCPEWWGKSPIVLGWPAVINEMTEMNLHSPRNTQEMTIYRTYPEHMKDIQGHHVLMQTLKSVPPLKLPGYEAGSKPTPGGCPVSNHGVKHSHAVDGAVGGQFSWSNLVSFSMLFAAGLVHEGCGGQSSILILTTKNSTKTAWRNFLLQTLTVMP